MRRYGLRNTNTGKNSPH